MAFQQRRHVALQVSDDLGRARGVVKVDDASGADRDLHEVGNRHSAGPVEIGGERPARALRTGRKHRQVAACRRIRDGYVQDHGSGVSRHAVSTGDRQPDSLSACQRSQLAARAVARIHDAQRGQRRIGTARDHGWRRRRTGGCG